MDFKDIKNQLVHQLMRHIKHYYIFNILYKQKIDDDLKQYIEKLKQINEKYPYLDIDIDDKFIYHGNEKNETIKQWYMNEIDKLNVAGKIRNIRRILDTSDGINMKRTESISVLLCDVNPEIMKGLRFYIGLDKVVVRDKMERTRMDNFFKMIKQCKYCHGIGHTAVTCHVKRQQYFNYMDRLRHQRQNGDITEKQFHVLKHRHYPWSICQKCGDGHATENCGLKVPKCKLCGGKHFARVNMKCDLIKKLYQLYYNALEMKKLGIEIKKWSNKNILNYKEILKKQKEQEQRIIQQQNEENNNNMDQDDEDDDNDIMNNVTVDINRNEKEEKEIEVGGGDKQSKLIAKVVTDQIDLLNQTMANSGGNKIVDSNNNNNNDNDDIDDEDENDDANSSRSNLVSTDDEQ